MGIKKVYHMDIDDFQLNDQKAVDSNKVVKLDETKSAKAKLINQLNEEMNQTILQLQTKIQSTIASN